RGNCQPSLAGASNPSTDEGNGAEFFVKCASSLSPDETGKRWSRNRRNGESENRGAGDPPLSVSPIPRFLFPLRKGVCHEWGTPARSDRLGQGLDLPHHRSKPRRGRLFLQ